MAKTDKEIIGRAEYVWLVTTNQKKISARIDTGARTTSIWASNIREKDGILTWSFFGAGSEYWTGNTMSTRAFEERVVSSSTGHRQFRYKVPVVLQIKGRRIKTNATLADRSHSAFPILIGRNTLNGKFIVDTQLGSRTLSNIEDTYSARLQSLKEDIQ